MATTTSTTLANEYQKYFSKMLLKHAIQLTVLDQFAYRAPLPRKVGAKTISFFRRSASSNNTSTGLVTAVQTLSEGVPINTFTDATLFRVDVPLVQYGEAAKITDIVSMTELFNALKQNTELMAEDCALHADDITRNALVAASVTGVTQNTASGTTTEYIGKLYAQGAANFAAMNALSVSAAKATAVDFLRAATQLKINRATTFGGSYVAVIGPQVAHDLQNDPDWIDSRNYGSPESRFRGELGKYAGVRFVEQTNSFLESSAGSEGTWAVTGSATTQLYRTFIFGQQSYGTPALSGDSPYSPRTIIVDKPDKSDPLNQFMTAGWKNYWAAQAINPQFALSLTSKTEFVGS